MSVREWGGVESAVGGATLNCGIMMERVEQSETFYRQRLTVSFEYPVHFCRNVFAADNPLLADTLAERATRLHRSQVFIDSGVVTARPGLVDEITGYFARHADRLRLEAAPEVVPGGEEAKNSREAAERVMQSIADHHLCRQSCVIAVGGGSALDIIGLAAALVHRGVRLVRVPTTTLSQGDSGVGVKNGIDAYGMKNFAGTFAPPYAVMVDYTFLSSLKWSYWIGGVAEAIKVAVVRDGTFFEYLRSNAARLRDRDESVIEGVVRRSAILHLEHIRTGGDPFEMGAVRPLDFGHWSAHRLEILSGYEIGHGQAVAIGMAMDADYACRSGLLSEHDLESILGVLESCGLPIWAGILDRRDASGRLEVLAGLEDFREHLGGELTVTLPRGLGSRLEVHDMDPSLIVAGINALGQRARRNGSMWKP